MSELSNIKVFVLYLMVPLTPQLPYSEAILTVKHKKEFCIKAASEKQQTTH